MDDQQAAHLNEDQEQFAGDPVDEQDGGQDPAPRYGETASFTPRPGRRRDGGWKPDEYPHGEPDPGPSLEEDPGARGPQARTALPRANALPVPPEAVVEDRSDDPLNIDERSGSHSG